MQDLPKILVPSKPKAESHVYGIVRSVSDATVGVHLDGAVNSDGTPRVTACERFCACHVGDRVLVVIMATGRCAAVGVIPTVQPNKVLWEGAAYMFASQTVMLAEPISEQSNGIVLEWGCYYGSVVNSCETNYKFIPKSHIVFNPGNGVFSTGVNHNLESFHKYVYVHDDRISGNDKNSSGAAGNVVLVRVIGV